MNINPMKALIFCGLAGLIAGCAEVVPPAPEVATPMKEVKPAARPFKITDEQRAKLREQREKVLAERKAKMEEQMLEVVRKYVPDEEQAKALANELQETIMAGRRNMMRQSRPSAAKPAETR